MCLLEVQQVQVVLLLQQREHICLAVGVESPWAISGWNLNAIVLKSLIFFHVIYWVKLIHKFFWYYFSMLCVGKAILLQVELKKVVNRLAVGAVGIIIIILFLHFWLQAQLEIALVVLAYL